MSKSEQGQALVSEFRVRLTHPTKAQTYTITGADLESVQNDVRLLIANATGKSPRFIQDAETDGVVNIYHEAFNSGNEPLAAINETKVPKHMSQGWMSDQRKKMQLAA